MDTVQNYLRVLNNQWLKVAFGVVFGSQVTGRSDHWSDIDLIVVSPTFDKRKTRQDVSLLWRLAAQTDSRIEPIMCGERQWHEDDSSAIIEIARRQGEKIILPEESY